MCGGKVHNSSVSNCVKMLDTENYLNRLIFNRVIRHIYVPGYLDKVSSVVCCNLNG